MSEVFYSKLTKYGLDELNSHTLEGTPFIADGWYIALGTGNIHPSLDTLNLTKPIYDKNSDNYPGISIFKEPIILKDKISGEEISTLVRIAAIQIPQELKNNIITEMGLFDENDRLMISAKTYIDLTRDYEQGITKIVNAGISLAAIPDNIDILTINTPSNFPTKEDINLILNDRIEAHNINPDSHEYLARKNGNTNNVFNVADAIEDTHAVNKLQAQRMFSDYDFSCDSVISLGEISGEVNLEFGKLYQATIVGDTTINLIKNPQYAWHMKNIYFHFIKNAGALTINGNLAWNQNIVPNLNVTNAQRIIFESINGGETIWMYYARYA